MKYGLFVSSLSPTGASQRRFQDAVLSGIDRLSLPGIKTTIYTYDVDIPDHFRNFPHDIISVPRPSLKYYLSRLFVHSLSAVAKLAGAYLKLPVIMSPAEREMIRRKERIIWFLTPHCFTIYQLPYVMTVWDLNWRIHSYFPEFSYTRHQFDGLEYEMFTRLTKASFVITGTREGGRQVTDFYGIPESKIRVLPFPTPQLDQVKQSPIDGLPDRYLFYPARFWPHKNHVCAIKALAELREIGHSSLHLVFTGKDEGNLGYVFEHAQLLGVADHVKYFGEVSEPCMVDVYRRATALVNPSFVGPDNLPPLEAFILGCPVITADVPGVREQLGDDACLYFDPKSPASLSSQVAELLESEAVRQRLIANGAQRASAWTATNYTDAMVDVLNEFFAFASAWKDNGVEFT